MWYGGGLSSVLFINAEDDIITECKEKFNNIILVGTKWDDGMNGNRQVKRVGEARTEGVEIVRPRKKTWERSWKGGDRHGGKQ